MSNDRPELHQPPITLVIGEHLYNRYTVRESPGGPTAPVKDLTGVTATFALRNHLNNQRIVKTGPPGVVVADAVNGLVDVIIPNTETATLDPQPHVHELRLTENGVERAAAAGEVSVIRLGF